MTDQLLTWEQAYKCDASTCGGKGWNLARLHHHGFKIPDGGIITNALYDEVISIPLIQNLIKQTSKLAPTNLSDIHNTTLFALHEAFINTALPEAFNRALENFLAQQQLTNQFISIRSSVNQEDGETASFAGIHDSVLNIRGIAESQRAILQCYASVWSARAICYRRKMGISDNEITMALVINRMVNVKSAGVAFSCDPASGRHDVITINANYGLGESVVAGSVEPDQYRLNRFHKEIIDQKIGQKEQLYRAKIDGGCEWLPTEPPNIACLNEAKQKELASLCDRVFHALGNGEVHQDVEWAFDGEQFVLLQARPVTVMKKVVCAEISDQPEVWSNGNFRDAVPMVQSHLTIEFCDQLINEILHLNFDGFYEVDPALRFGRQFEGRFYCNASLLQWLWFDSVGFPQEQFNISLGGHQPITKIDEQYKKGIGRKIGRLLRGIKFYCSMQRYRKHIPDIVKNEGAYAKHHRQIDYSALSNESMFESLKALRQHLEEYNRPFIMMTSLSGALFMLVQILEKHLGKRAYPLANTLMAGKADITSANHGHQLQHLAQLLNNEPTTKQIVTQNSFTPSEWQTTLPDSEFKVAFADFLEQYGHRAVYEMDLSRPCWRQDPSYLFDCIKGNLNTPRHQINSINHQQKVDEAWQEIRRHVPRYKYSQIKKQLTAAVLGAEAKELSKSIYVSLMEPMRNALSEIGKRFAEKNLLESKDDIFHCAQCEIEAILKNQWNGATLKALVATRKALKLQREDQPAPDVIIDNSPQQISSPKNKHHAGLTGIGAAVGIATGTARLIKTPDEGHRLQAGDVLVAPSTDPAWTPLFLNASAIVMETGGYLSHGAIVAREYGIPAVVNVAGVFSAIKNGETVKVNGDLGRVVILNG